MKARLETQKSLIITSAILQICACSVWALLAIRVEIEDIDIGPEVWGDFPPGQIEHVVANCSPWKALAGKFISLGFASKSIHDLRNYDTQNREAFHIHIF